MPMFYETPVISSPIYSRAGRKVFLKVESLQPSGSFKLRGISHLCEARAKQGTKRFISSSGGNAGMAVTYVGAMLGIPVIVFVPKSTPERAKALIQGLGGKVVVVEGDWSLAHQAAKAETKTGDMLVHPFDDPLIWSGHATLVDELLNQIEKPDAIVCSVGGGGLLCGIAEGLHRNGWGDVPIVAVETRGAASLAAAMKANRPVDVSPIATVATSLGAPIICDAAFHWSQRHPVFSLVIDDDDAIKGSLELMRSHRILTEPACGAAVAALNNDFQVINEASSVAVVICGGIGIDEQQLTSWFSRFPT